MKGLVKNGTLLYQGAKEALEMVFDIEHQQRQGQGKGTNDQLNSCLNSFYREQQGFLSLINASMNKLSTDVVNSMDSYHQNLSSIYNDGLSSIKQSIDLIKNQREKLTKAKLDYYTEYQNVEQMELETLKVFSGKFLESNNKLNSAHEKLLTQRAQMENKSLKYKQEITNINNLYDNHNATYKKTIQTLNEASKNKGILIQNLIEKTNKIFRNLFTQGIESSNRISSIFNSYNIDDDQKHFDNQLKETIYTNKDKEQFISFDIYKKKRQKDEKDKRESTMKSIELYSPLNKFIQAGETLMSYVDYEYLNHDDIITFSTIQFVKEEDKVKTIERFISNAFSTKDINSDKLDYLFQLSDQWVDFPQTFVECYFKSKQPKDFFKLLNTSNFNHLTNVFNSIISNISLLNQRDIEIINSIILIGEKTYCNNTFLCAMLSKNKFFSDKSNWFIIIEEKLLVLLNSKASKMMIEEKNSRPFYMPNIAKFLYYEDYEVNKLEQLGLDKRVTNYKSLTRKQKEVLHQSIDGDLHLTLKRVIPHLCNYRLNMKEAIDLIIEYSKRYAISEEKTNYYITYLNTSNCSIVKKLPLAISNPNAKNIGINDDKSDIDSLTGSIICENSTKISEIKSHQAEIIKLKYSCQIKNHNDIIKLLSFCFKYLPQEDFVSLMLINKSIGTKLKIKIYRYVLKRSDTLPLKTHMKIWASILSVYSLKKDFDYKQCLQYSISGQKKKYDIIDLDVKRTFFKQNSEQGREVIRRILRTFVFLKPNISYCQGMNYIAAFIYQIIQDEETAFYLLLGLFSHTDFYMIFLEDLKKLKIFFYVFDRLILLYLPQIYYYFISQTLSVNFFASPWFITLFTNAYPSINDETKPHVLIKIWDLFLLKGWRGLMSSVLTLIKFNSDDILSCQNDDLLQFMINDLVKSPIFQNKSYKVFNQILETIHIPRLLVTNLEEEIDIEQGIENTQVSMLLEKAHQV